MKRKCIWWLLAIAWCMFIFFKSGKPSVESAEESMFATTVINQLFNSLFGQGRFQVDDYLIRKTAHFIEYFILGFLFYKAYFNAEKLKRTLWLSITTAILYSISDEIHQHFVPGRAMRATDVMIDSAGILLAVLVLYLRTRSHKAEALS